MQAAPLPVLRQRVRTENMPELPLEGIAVWDRNAFTGQAAVDIAFESRHDVEAAASGDEEPYFWSTFFMAQGERCGE